MTHEWIIGGVLISTVVYTALLSWVMTVLIDRILEWTGFFSLIWRRPLVELAVFCIIWGVLVSWMPDGAVLG